MKILHNISFLVTATAVFYIFAGLNYLPTFPGAGGSSLQLLGPEQGSERELVQLWIRWAFGVGAALIFAGIGYRVTRAGFRKWMTVIQLALIAFCIAAQLPPLMFWIYFALSDFKQTGLVMPLLHLLLLLLAGASFLRLLDELKLEKYFQINRNYSKLNDNN